MECIPPPNTSNGAPDQTKTADHIFMKILPEMYTGILHYNLEFIHRAQTLICDPCCQVEIHVLY